MALNQKMLKAIELMVYTDKQKQEICKELGVAGNAISRWLAREDFQQALQAEMHRGFSDLAIKARRKLGKLIDSKNDGVALGACREALNKAGYMETQKVDANANVETTINVSIE